jgi:hypothetical protein
MTFEQLKILAKEGASSVKQKNAVQPLLWACLVVTAPCFYFCTTTQSPIREWLFYAGCGPLVLLAIAYLWFMFVDPSRLQSEEYQLRSRVLDIIESKGGNLKIEPTNINQVLTSAEPSRRRLDSGAGDRQ